jgi:hypothetical protein
MKSKYWMVLITVLLGLGLSVPVLHADAKKPVVLFDQGHGQAFVIEQNGDLHLSGLAGLFREGGFEVKAGRQTITPELLAGVDGLVISGPFTAFTAAEAGTIKKFVERGGCVTVMVHITPPVLNILGEFGIASTNGPINETKNVLGGGGKDFSVTRLKPHPITKGLHKFSAYGAWGLNPERGNAKIIARTGPKSWVDLNRNGRFESGDGQGEFGVIIAGTLGKGEFAVFGDDAIFQNRFLKDDNLLLGKNLVNWMREKLSGRLSI